MAFTDDQKRALLTNLARDKAENLRNEIARMMAETKANAADRTDLSEEDRRMGELAMEKAMQSAQRMVDNMNHALRLAEEMAQESGEGGQRQE